MSPIPINLSFNETRQENYQCEQHNLPFENWSIKEKNFTCRRCIIERDLQTSELQSLVDAIPLVKADIHDRIAEANDYLQKDFKTIDNFVNQYSYKLNFVIGFQKKIRELENTLRSLIGEAEVTRTNRLKDLSLLKKVDEEIEEIQSEEHLPLLISSRAALVSIKRPWRLPTLSSLQSNLCNIACNFIEGNIKDDRQAGTALIGAAKKSVDSSQSQPKSVHDAGELSENGIWIMNGTNCQTVLQALANRQPRLIVLQSRHDKEDRLPKECVTEVVKAVKKCEVNLKLYHSFFKPEENKTDEELLQYFLNNSRVNLSTFFGHLDAVGITKLPSTVNFLGLSLNCASDAIALSSLKPWDNLLRLLVSVSNNVAASDLCMLPSLDSISLHFPGLTDDRVTSVRPSIEALVPDLEFLNLNFPLSLLSAAGTHRLVQQLQGIHVDEVAIELCGSWQPQKWEKDSIATDLIIAVGCISVSWDLDRLYTDV